MLDLIAREDARRDAVEAELRGEVEALHASLAESVEQVRRLVAQSERRTLAVGLMIAELTRLGMTRSEIDQLTLGALDLGDGT